MTQDQIDHIIDTKAIPYPTDEIQLKETHISWVILYDDYVFKIKKPVSFDFLDFSKLEKRKHYCREEVKLNQRLAPSMYLGVRAIKKTDEKYQIGNCVDVGQARITGKNKNVPCFSVHLF
jgi:aminoglycoside phosphotransferase family enzyme